MAVCPTCGEENPARARFCLNCGAPLVAAPLRPAEERKVVTVLFCDLVGFTAASDQVDPEDVRARIRPYHARLRSEIERYGGTVEKFIGDAVMAVFGAPVAHEDDAERAVRAGLRVLEAIADLNEGDSGLDLQVRVGIETGEAVVALSARPEQGEGIVTGDVVNTASRLQGAAPVNGVAVGEGTYQATREVFDYQALEPVTLKGKGEPVQLWHAKAARARFGTDLTRRLTTPLVGRELERTLLTGVFERAVRDASTQLITIVGEPGVGKSRLVAELSGFIEAWPDLVRWRQGRCLPYGDAVTFWALGEIVKGEAGILETDPPEVAASKIDAVVPDGHPDAPWLRQRLRPLVGLEAPEAAREENFAAWRVFLEALAEARPSVFVFEDLHWADDAFLAFLEHLADYAEGMSMLLVGTARPELFEKAPGFALTARNSHRINLPPLSEQETARLIANLLAQAVLPIEVQSAILTRSGGNPLYAEEFVRLLKDRGILTKERATWRIDPAANVPLPSGVQGLIAARLDTLSPERKRLLQDASVVGKVFWSGAVAEMGEQDLKEVRAALHELSRKELVRPARSSSMEGQTEYAFLHALVRDVCYAQIPRAARADRHRRAAAWIESVAGERREDHAEILAHHYLTALELARAAGRKDVEDLEASALRFLLLAGERALGLETAKAEANFAKALELAPPGHTQRAAVLVRWADAARQAGRHGEAARALGEAIEQFRERGDLIGAARGLTTLANVLWFSGDTRSLEVAAEGQALLETEPPGPDLVAASAELARQQVLRGNTREGIGWAERAMALAGDLHLEESAKALGYRALGRCWLGDAGGLEDFRRALPLALAQGRGRETSVLYTNLAVSLWPFEGPAASAAAFREGSAFSHARGIAESAHVIDAELLDPLVDLGSWDEVLETGTRLANELEVAWSVQSLLDVRRAQVRVLVMRGEADVAVPLAKEAVEVGGRVSADRARISLCLSALASLGVGDTARARAAAIQLVQIPRFWEAFFWPAYLPAMVRMAVALGDIEVAEQLMANESVHPYGRHAQVAARAFVAQAKGETETAVRLYAEAAERWERFGVVPERAFALLGHGRSLVALNRSGDASEPLQTARKIFASLGAKPSLSETDRLLEQATALAS